MSKSELPSAETQKLFYLGKEIENRHIPLLNAYDENNVLNYWIPSEGVLMNIKPSNLIEGEYFSKEKIEEQDVYIPFINFLYQKVTTEKIFGRYNGLINDILNLTNSLEKIKLFYLQKHEYEIRRFVITEIEYIFYVCRSIYDLVQKLIKSIWDNSGSTGKQLSDSFADMTLKNDRPLETEEIKKRYGLTDRLALFYSNEALFFAQIRTFRNQIDHHGKTNQFILVEPNLGTLRNFTPFESFGIWNEDTFLNKNIAPIKPIVCYVIKKTIDAMNNFVNAAQNDIKFPNDIAPDYKVFLRSPYTNNINELTQNIETDVWY